MTNFFGGDDSFEAVEVVQCEDRKPFQTLH